MLQAWSEERAFKQAALDKPIGSAPRRDLGR